MPHQVTSQQTPPVTEHLIYISTLGRMYKRGVGLLTLSLLLLLNFAFAVEPPEAIGSLFLESTQKYLCTATAVLGNELGLEQEMVVLTAAHCVEGGIKEAAGAHGWLNEESYVVSFDGKQFYGVHPHRVGFAKAGYDIAVLTFTNTTPDITPLHMGSWEQVDFGSGIHNYANPLGMGIQYFTGSVTMMHITPSPINKKPQWHHNAVASVQVGPGSSGSLILNESYEYIGVLSGVMEARFGSPFTIFVPQWRFEDFLIDETAGRDLPCLACEQAKQVFYAQMGDAVVD